MSKFKKPPDKDTKKVKKEDYVDTDKINKYIKHLTSYRGVKTSLNSIIRDDKTLIKINEFVLRGNKIVIHTYHFLKLFCLNQFNLKGTIPTIDKKFISLIMKTISSSDGSNGGRKFSEKSKNIKDELNRFYESIYKSLIPKSEKDLTYSKLNNILEYEAESIVTCLSNHIQENFDHMVNRFINIMTQKGKIEDKIKEQCEKNKESSEPLLRKFRNDLSKVKYDILNNGDKSDEKYGLLITNFKKTIMKDIIVDKSLSYTMESNPLSLLLPLIRMSIKGENTYRKNLGDDKKDELFGVINCFPLRKNLVPKYVDIDLSVIISNFVENDLDYYNKNKLINSDKLWNMFFKMDSKVFKKKGYTFNRRISTDGFGCSLLFIRNDLYKPDKKSYVKQMKKPKGFVNDIYVNDLSNEQKKECLKMKIVGIDPGINDLIFCTDGEAKTIKKPNGKIYRKVNKYRYSQLNRNFTTKKGIYETKRINLKKTSYFTINKDLMKMTKSEKDKQSIIELETHLSKYNSNSCIYDNCLKYIKLKNNLNYYLMNHYKEEIYRKLKWYSFINKQKADMEMVNGFRKKFGKSKDVCILIGDYEQKNHMKHKEPTKGKSIRKLFKKNGYKLYLVDEFRTSKYLYELGEELINLRGEHSLLGSKIYHNLLENAKSKVIDPKTKKERIEYAKKDVGRGTIINRDLNGSLNIRLKGLKILKNEEIPEYMRRGNKSKEDITDEEEILMYERISKLSNLVTNEKTKIDNIKGKDIIDINKNIVTKKEIRKPKGRTIKEVKETPKKPLKAKAIKNK